MVDHLVVTIFQAAGANVLPAAEGRMGEGALRFQRIRTVLQQHVRRRRFGVQGARRFRTVRHSALRFGRARAEGRVQFRTGRLKLRVGRGAACRDGGTFASIARQGEPPRRDVQISDVLLQ